MRYTWECSQCKDQQVVERRMAELDVGPTDPCKCASTAFRRIIAKEHAPGTKGFILERGKVGGFHEFEYTRYRSIK